MTTQPALFAPLTSAARDELAKQIDGQSDARRLLAVGFGWDLAKEITRQIGLGEGNAGVLWKMGLSGQVATAVANAIKTKTAPVAPAVPKVKTSSQGAKRGAQRSYRTLRFD